jgi:hypothetical protein
MKRLVVRLSLACLVGLFAFAGTAHAVPRLTAGIVRGFPGRTVEVPVSLSYRTNDARDVVALQADVVFDATGVADGPPAGGGILTSHVLASSAPSAGTRRLLVYSPGNAVLTNGEVARIPFSVGANEYRNFALRLTNVILVRAEATEVPNTTGNGAIAVNQVFLAPDGHADGSISVASNMVEQCYVIQATTDFVTWVNVQTNSAEGALLPFVDAEAGGFPKRFYRAVVCDAASGLGIGTITQLANGRVQFDFNGASGRSYLIQASTNLTDWQNIRTNVGASGPITFTDAFTNYARRFYRVRALE